MSGYALCNAASDDSVKRGAICGSESCDPQTQMQHVGGAKSAQVVAPDLTVDSMLFDLVV